MSRLMYVLIPAITVLLLALMFVLLIGHMNVHSLGVGLQGWGVHFNIDAK